MIGLILLLPLFQMPTVIYNFDYEFLVIKTKPMYMFMNMLFQHQVEPRPSEPAPGGEGFVARNDEEDFNHPKGGY